MPDADTTRRSVLTALWTAVLVACAGCSARRPIRSGDEIDALFQRDGDGDDTLRIPPGVYEWNGTDLDVDTALVGEGEPGDVVFRLRAGTMEGSVRGELENIVVEGRNRESKAGLDLYPGGEIDGFCWPDGGGRDQDRAIYHPEAGERTTIRNSCVAGMANNGAYVDKAPVTVRNCAFVNNNIANLRVGHADGSRRDATSYVADSLVAVTGGVRTGPNASSENPIGLRIRRPGRFVVEGCWFVFTSDAPGSDGLVELKGDDVDVAFRDCHFHNDTDNMLIRDGGSGNAITLSDCTVSGSGRTVPSESTVVGSLERADVRVPVPSTITGFPQADEAYGFDPTLAPFEG